jgi:hypothetical protein
MVELTALRKEVGEMRSIEQELKEARSELMLARLSLKNAAAKLGKSGGVARCTDGETCFTPRRPWREIGETRGSGTCHVTG